MRIVAEPKEISKTQRKKAMLDLQALGAELVDLNNARLKQLDLSAELLEAIAEFKRLRSREALRRQMQYIGRLMREENVGQIRSAMQDWLNRERQETSEFHTVELWRDRLLADATAWQEFALHFPASASENLRALVAEARRERLANHPAKSARKLFRALREALLTRDHDS